MLKSYFLPWPNTRGFIRVIADSENEAALESLGYKKLEAEAIAATEAADKELASTPEPRQSPAPQTRVELESEAQRLGVTFHWRTSDKKLAESIAAAKGKG